jgi:phosphopentomutase
VFFPGFAKVTVRNYGKIPATKITTLCRFDKRKGVITPHPPAGDLVGSDVIGAGLSRTFTLIMDASQDQILQIQRNEASLMMAVRFRYTDAINTQGDTVYSAFYMTSSEKNPGPHFIEMPSGGWVS